MPATENSNNFWNLGWGDHGTQPLNTAYDAKKRKGFPVQTHQELWNTTARVPPNLAYSVCFAGSIPCFVGI